MKAEEPWKKRETEYIPKPKSRFYMAKCPNCGHEQILYSHSTLVVECMVCGNVLAEPRGGKAKIRARIIKELG